MIVTAALLSCRRRAAQESRPHRHIARHPHPNVLAPEFFIENKNGPCAVVFPYMERDVHSFWAHHFGLLPLSTVQRICADACQGLQYLHSWNMIHRDVKPGNMLMAFGPPSRTVLADFGWCRQSVQGNRLTPGVVTEPYRPPEVVMGSRDYTTSLDMWSMGVSLMQLLSGKHFPYGQKKQLFGCIQLLTGPINEETWPGCSKFPGYTACVEELSKSSGKTSCMPFQNPQRPLDPDGEDLAKRMMALRPECRISASESLQHPFFANGATAPVDTIEPAAGAAASATAAPAVPAEKTASHSPAERAADEAATGQGGVNGAASLVTVDAKAEAAMKGGSGKPVRHRLTRKTNSRIVSSRVSEAKTDAGTTGADASGGVNAPAAAPAQEENREGGPEVPTTLEDTSDSQHVATPHAKRRKIGISLASACESPGALATPMKLKHELAKKIDTGNFLEEQAEIVKADRSRRCNCRGYACLLRWRVHDRAEWDGGRYPCRLPKEAGSDFCLACKCAVDGCPCVAASGKGVCRRLDHMMLTLPVEMGVIRMLAGQLADSDPIDVQGFILESGDVDDMLLLCLLADCWEPAVMTALKGAFASLPAKYTAHQLATAILQAATAPGSRMRSHLKILAIAGSCRHFGLMSLLKRLRLVVTARPERQGAGVITPRSGRSAKARESVFAPFAVGLLGELVEPTGDLSVLEKLIAHNRAHGRETFKRATARHRSIHTMWKAFGDYIFATTVPACLMWGRKPNTYHGQCLARKLLMRFWPGEKGISFTYSVLKDISPDRGAFLAALPRDLRSPRRLQLAFQPLQITRLSAWTCLFHHAFESVEGFREVCASGRLTPSVWEHASRTLVEQSGHNHHPSQVAEVAMSILRNEPVDFSKYL